MIEAVDACLVLATWLMVDGHNNSSEENTKDRGEGGGQSIHEYALSRTAMNIEQPFFSKCCETPSQF